MTRLTAIPSAAIITLAASRSQGTFKKDNEFDVILKASNWRLKLLAEPISFIVAYGQIGKNGKIAILCVTFGQLNSLQQCRPLVKIFELIVLIIIDHSKIWKWSFLNCFTYQWRKELQAPKLSSCWMLVGSTSSEEWFLASDFGAYVLFVNKEALDRLATTDVW